MGRVFILLIGVWACSTSVIFIKLSRTDPILLAGYRQVLAAILLIPVFARTLRKGRAAFTPELLKRSLPAAFFLAVHFISWIAGARLTPAAHSSLIVNMVPIVMPFLLYFLIDERLTRVECAGTVLALSGLLVLGLADFRFAVDYAVGDVICFVSMVLYALYLAQARKNRDFPSIWHYVFPVYFIGGILCLIVALAAWAGGWIQAPHKQPLDLVEIVCIVGLAVVPTVVGHSIINFSLTRLRGQTVVVINLSQFVFAGVMAFYLLDEVPTLSFYGASALLVSGAVIVILAASRHELPDPAPG
jgi:drug/metabolite transporter (DMT)-like permease